MNEILLLADKFSDKQYQNLFIHCVDESAAKMLRAALDAEEQARLELRVAARSNMTDAQRAEERATIEELMGACPGIIPDEEEQERLIGLGLVPVTDPFSQNDGIDPSDLVAVHGICMSRSELFLYLDRNRDNFGNPPAMPDGLLISESDMRSLGLEPSEYGFFNEALPRVHQVPAIQELDLAALGLDVEEVRAIEDAMDEIGAENDYAAGTFPSHIAAEDFYLTELSRDALPLSYFIELLERPYTVVEQGRTSPPNKIKADQISLIANLTQSHSSRYDYAHSIEENRPVSLHRLRAKVEYLLSTWRSARGRRYNIYLRNNAELRAVLRTYVWPIITALISHAVDTLMFPFIVTEGGQMAALVTRALAIDSPDEEREQIVRRINQSAIMRRDSPEVQRLHITIYERFVARCNGISQGLAAMGVEQFRSAFSEFRNGRSAFSRFHFDIVVPEWFLEEDENFTITSFTSYNPVMSDLIRYIARQEEKIAIFVSLYRGLVDDQRVAPLDISRDNWKMLSLVLNYPVSLLALLQNNYYNERLPANRNTPIAVKMEREVKEMFIASVDDPQSIARMRFYFGLSDGPEPDPPPARRVPLVDISE